MKVEARTIIWGCVIVIGMILINIIGLKVQERPLIEKVTQNVLYNLQRNYTPGPYSPGYDPDKVDPRVKR